MIMKNDNPSTKTIQASAPNGEIKEVTLYAVTDIDGTIEYCNRHGRVIPRAEYAKPVAPVQIIK
jgi:hypothetical protein